jgi:hypothetical protein
VDATTLATFRQAVYRSFTRSGDALFELIDALLTHPGARSFVELSEAPSCRRRWCSGYAALQDGRVDRPALRRAFAAALPPPPAGERLVLGLDSSAIHRPAAHTFPDRTLVYCPNLPRGARPVRPGWQFSTVAALPDPVSSWTYVLDNQRIPSAETATTVGDQQLRALLPLLAARPIVVADGHYGCTAWVAAAAALPCDQLLRTRRDRVLYRPAPPRTGRRGAPRKDGPRFQGSDPATHGTPDGHWDGADARGQRVSVTCWGGLHLKACRQAAITAVRIVRQGATGGARDPREAWFWWLGGPLPPLAALPHLSARRFGLEHGYKCDKQHLLWDAPRVRTPAQFERWTDLVAAAHNHLALARPLVAVTHRPWEARAKPATPQQARRAMPRILPRLGTPAAPPRPRGKSPGRAAGTPVKRAARHPVLRKRAKPRAA